MRIIISSMLVILSFLLAVPSEAALISNLRVGAYTDKTRIVLDLDAVPQYSEILSGSQLSINIDADVKQEYLLTPKSDFVKKVTAHKDGQGKTKITIDLANTDGSYKIFALKAPNRLVIDFYRYVLSKQVTEIDKDLRYISWRDYQNDKPTTRCVRAAANSGQGKYHRQGKALSCGSADRCFCSYKLFLF